MYACMCVWYDWMNEGTHAWNECLTRMNECMKEWIGERIVGWARPCMPSQSYAASSRPVTESSVPVVVRWFNGWQNSDQSKSTIEMSLFISHWFRTSAKKFGDTWKAVPRHLQWVLKLRLQFYSFLIYEPQVLFKKDPIHNQTPLSSLNPNLWTFEGADSKADLVHGRAQARIDVRWSP